MFGEQYKTWLLSRDEGIRSSCASRVYGNSQEAYDNAIAGQQRLAEDHNARSLGGFATTAVLQARRKEREAFEEKIKVIIDGVLDPYRQRKNQKLNGNHSTVDEFRWGRCGDCNTLVLGKDTNCYHECAKNSPGRKLSEDLFPTLIRIMYTHDVFNDPVLSSLIPTFSHFGLQRVAVQDVLERPGNMGVLLKTILPMLSTCPSDFVPTNSKQRGAPWGSCRAPPDEWIGKHLLRCDFGTLALVNPPLQHHYDHACSQTPQREDAERQEKQRLGLKYSQNKSAGGPHDCGTQRVIRVKSLLQLPSEYLRRYWFHKRIFPIIAKKAKKGKGKAQ
ncbi:hypothetical protein B0H11DRAFT_2238832 [Mycena galericulata]|nr:hypothetical protein B0H11DRAFT_2238832 [Mycena galericulata]